MSSSRGVRRADKGKAIAQDDDVMINVSQLRGTTPSVGDHNPEGDDCIDWSDSDIDRTYRAAASFAEVEIPTPDAEQDASPPPQRSQKGKGVAKEGKTLKSDIFTKHFKKLEVVDSLAAPPQDGRKRYRAQCNYCTTSYAFKEGGGYGNMRTHLNRAHPDKVGITTSQTQIRTAGGQISDADNYLERTFLSPASMRATRLIQSWMQDAGLKTWVDQMGNLHGRSEAVNSTAEAVLIGSHLDTVIDAGMYDGSLGVICAIAAVKAMKISGRLHKLHRPIEVIAFSDEEGVRFQSTFLGSAAIAGTMSRSMLQTSDKSGITVQDVLRTNSFQGTDESLVQVKYDPESVWGYVEVHIEQGPVLESLGHPVGIVKGIAGQTRLKVSVEGSQGHAGTVPMYMRRDPMAASAELIGSLESLCKNPEHFVAYDSQCGRFRKEYFEGLVCTVGEISAWPGASNVIPGQVTFTVDIRAVDDMARESVILSFSNRVNKICDQRMVNCTIDHKHGAEAAHCDSELSLQLKDAAHFAVKKMSTDIQGDVPVLMSGAGHDAMAMSRLTKIGMIFVRCRGGVSHSPQEFVLDDDIWAAGLTLLQFLETNF